MTESPTCCGMGAIYAATVNGTPGQPGLQSAPPEGMLFERTIFRRLNVVRAFILIEVAAGYSSAIAENLSGGKGFVDVVRVTGPVDVIAVVEASTLPEISALVSDRIHSLQGVMRTTTCVALH